MTKFILFLLFPVILWAADEEDFSHDSPYTIERMNQAKISDKKWERFQDEMAWFLDYSDPLKNFGPLDDVEEEKYLREKWSREQEKLAKALVKSDEAFLQFRRCIGESIRAIGTGRYYEYASAQAGIDVTNWYIEFMEGEFFPHNWKELYENDKKANTLSK